MSYRKPSNLNDLLLHIITIVGIGVGLVLAIFYLWLPILTNHGETITVPDIEGMQFSEINNFLSKRNLRFEVSEDSSYSANFPPLAVLRQFPKPNTKVKENRKIYLTLNSERPPLVKMPKLQDLSLKAAQMVLKTYELKLGEISYIPDPIAFGTIHDAKVNGRSVLEGERIEKGTVIDLVAGDGYGNQTFQSPFLIGLLKEEAETVILGSGLKVRNIYFTKENNAIISPNDSTNQIRTFQKIGPGEIYKQIPEPGTTLKINDVIDLWVYRPDSINNSSNILDNN